MLGRHVTTINEQNDTDNENVNLEKVREEARLAIKCLPKLSGSTHEVELCLQHIFANAGGETGEPDSEEYMLKLYPDDYEPLGRDVDGGR